VDVHDAPPHVIVALPDTMETMAPEHCISGRFQYDGRRSQRSLHQRARGLLRHVARPTAPDTITTDVGVEISQYQQLKGFMKNHTPLPGADNTTRIALIKAGRLERTACCFVRDQTQLGLPFVASALAGAASCAAPLRSADGTPPDPAHL
jgi:hypothetical protein